MTEFLIVRTDPDHSDQAEWTLVNELGAQLAPPERGALAVATRLAFGRKVIGIVPATRILRTAIDLPVKGATRQLQALPFAMEEQIAEDVDAMHFAIGKRGSDGLVPVAVTRRENMDEWLGIFQQVGLELAGLYSEGDALGDMPGTALLLIEPQHAILRDADGSVTFIDPDNLRATLEIWLARKQSVSKDDDAETQQPVNLLVYVSGADIAPYDSLIEWLRMQVSSIDDRLLPDGPLPRMAAQIATHPGVNLLQAGYAPRSNLAGLWPAWRTAALLLIGVLAAWLAVTGAELASLSSQSARLDTAIEDAFRYTFPEVTEVRDPRSLLDSKLRSLGAAGSGDPGNGFLDALTVVSSAMKDIEATRIEAISYRTGIMDLRIRTDGVETLDRIQQGVSESRGFAAEIQSANADGEEILGRLQVKLQ